MMWILINNIKVLGVFGASGILMMLFIGLLMLNAEKYRIIGFPFVVILIAFVLFGYLWLHFLSGKHFLHSTGNLLLDGASFILIIVFAVICALNFENMVLRVLFSPSFLLEGFVQETLSVCVAVFLPILMQFLGMVKSIK